MFKKITIFCFIATCITSFTFTAHAGIAISRAVVEYTAGDRSNKDVVVYNHGDRTEYIKVELFKVSNPGEKSETKEILKTGRDKGLMVNPQKLIIPAHSSKVVRFINLHKKVTEEKVYRATVTPSTAIARDVKSSEGKVNAAVKMVIAYGLLLKIEPDEVKTNIVGNRSGKKATITNKGNASALFLDGKQCNTSGKKCTEIKGKRLYQGRTWFLTLPYNTPLEFSYRSGGKVYRKTF
ncbi:MAG: hypothetical protein ACTSXQ_01190 [Alphaproteobacteria bacterium]